MVADYGLLFREIEFDIGSLASFCLATILALVAISNFFRRRTELGRAQLALGVPHIGNWIFFTWVWLISISRIAGFRTEWDPRHYFYSGYIGIGITALGALWAIYEISPRKWATAITVGTVAVIVLGTLAVHVAAWIYTGGHLNLTPVR